VAKRSLAEQVLDSIVRSSAYDVVRSGFRLAVRDDRGNNIATIQFNDVPDHPRCVIRRLGRLVAQCHYSTNNGWVIFPIDHGKIAKEPLTRTDLLTFLKDFEKTRSREMVTAAAAS
jgi:hypothetical protein